MLGRRLQISSEDRPFLFKMSTPTLTYLSKGCFMSFWCWTRNLAQCSKQFLFVCLLDQLLGTLNTKSLNCFLLLDYLITNKTVFIKTTLKIITKQNKKTTTAKPWAVWFFKLPTKQQQTHWLGGERMQALVWRTHNPPWNNRTWIHFTQFSWWKYYAERGLFYLSPTFYFWF